jgi:hypothetical protein
MEIGRERSAPSLFVKRREVATLLHAGGGAPLLKDLPVLGAASALASCALLAAQRQDRYAEPHGAPPTRPATRRSRSGRMRSGSGSTGSGCAATRTIPLRRPASGATSAPLKPPASRARRRW